jgi:hypothetical protein
MPEKVRAYERRSLVIHKGILVVQAALVLLLDDDPDPDEPDEPDDDPDEEEDEDPFDESDDFDPLEEDSDDEEEDDSLLAGSVLVPEERLSLR